MLGAPRAEDPTRTVTYVEGERPGMAKTFRTYEPDQMLLLPSSLQDEEMGMKRSFARRER